jgi:ferric-chelate reductase
MSTLLSFSLLSARADAPAKASDPDRIARIAHAQDYPRRVWYALACFIAFLTLWNILGLLYGRLRRTASKKPKRGVISYRRLPLALANGFRAIAFRSTLSFGAYTVNITEVVLTAAYAALIFGCTLMNCRP